MKSTVFLLLCCLSPLLLNAQSHINKISGQIFRKTPGGEKTHLRVGAAIFIPGIASATTDDEGKYTLDLSQCRSCVPGGTLTIKVNSDFGYAEKIYTVPNADPRPPVDIEVVENKTLALTGLVRDRTTGRVISGVQVSALVQHYPGVIPSAPTDERGIFQIVLQKDGILNLQAINLSVMDPGKRFKDVDQVKFINPYEPVKIELEPSGKTEVDNARSLATEEVLSNIQHLDSRLLFIAHALKLDEKDAFTIRFDSVFRAIAPGLSPNPGSNLDKLDTRTMIASLRQALNSVPLRDDFGKALVQVFINADMQHETPTIDLYLKQFREVGWAEEALFNAMDAYADAKDTCKAQQERIALGWATVRNRAALYQLYALRLLDALAVQSPSVSATMENLRLLNPRQPLSQKEFEKHLNTRTMEMATLVNQKAQLQSALARCRDRTLDEGIEKINKMLTIYPTDTWQEVIVKARTLRELGRLEEAVDAFIKYGQMFGNTDDTTATPYSQTAVRFTRHIRELDVDGGVYLYAYAEKSNIHTAGVQIGDILIEAQGEKITGTDQVIRKLMNMAPGVPVELVFLRWNEERHTFEPHEYTIPSKPMGGMFMPI